MAEGDWGSGSLVARSAGMREIGRELDLVARSDVPVLITGESGTGKEVAARELHRRSARSAGPWVVVNCAALSDSLLEDDLFGHARGAFTHAVERRLGRFASASGGTLLLDEVAELSPHAQLRLLRVIESGVVDPLGTDTPVEIDVRVVSATHQSLSALVAQGRFREDLLYRLNVFELHLPPLRERPEDLEELIERLLCQEGGADAPQRLTPGARDALMLHDWPGTVRELLHALQHALVRADGGPIETAHLPLGHGASSPCAAPPAPLAEALRRAERAHIERALAYCHGNRSAAARLLGISRKTLWAKLRAPDTAT